MARAAMLSVAVMFLAAHCDALTLSNPNTADLRSSMDLELDSDKTKFVDKSGASGQAELEHEVRLQQEIKILNDEVASSGRTLAEELQHEQGLLAQVRDLNDQIAKEKVKENGMKRQIAKLQSEKESWKQEEENTKKRLQKSQELVSKSSAEMRKENKAKGGLKNQVFALQKEIASLKKEMEEHEIAATNEIKKKDENTATQANYWFDKEVQYLQRIEELQKQQAMSAKLIQGLPAQQPPQQPPQQMSQSQLIYAQYMQKVQELEKLQNQAPPMQLPGQQPPQQISQMQPQPFVAQPPAEYPMPPPSAFFEKAL